jgi:N-acetylglutamate synthase-like GNAT family acetyltransferase
LIIMRIDHTTENGVHRYECWDDYGCSVVASAVAVEENGHINLREINVGRSYRGRGLGTLLLEQVIADFSDRDLVASVFEERVPWYRRHGFEPVESRGGLIEVKRRGQSLKMIPRI